MAKNPKGRGGTSTLRLEHPADKLRAMGNRKSLGKTRSTLPGADLGKQTGPKPVRLTAEQ